MILTLSGRDEARFPRLFDAIYRQRYDVFVCRRGWRLPERQHGLERDGFDTASATYVVQLGPNHTFPAGARLLSTEGPHLLADVFPHLVAGYVPRGRAIRELTRFYVTGPGDTSVRRQRVDRLSRAIFSYSLDRGITTLTGVVDTFLLPIMTRHGWVFEPLGPPRPYAEGSAVAFAVCVATSLRELRLREDQGAVPAARVAPLPCPP